MPCHKMHSVQLLEYQLLVQVSVKAGRNVNLNIVLYRMPYGKGTLALPKLQVQAKRQAGA